MSLSRTARLFTSPSAKLLARPPRFPVLNGARALCSDAPDDCYRIVLNVAKFSLNEIKIRTEQVTTIQVDALQEATDEKGFSKNHVNLQYVIPTVYDGEKLNAKLSSGVLVISAPKIDGSPEDHMKEVQICK